MLMTNTGESRFPSYTSPTLHICVSSTSPQAVLGTNAMASQKFITLLADMQAARHVPVKSRITVTRLAQAVPEPITGRPGRPTSVLLLIGVLPRWRWRCGATRCSPAGSSSASSAWLRPASRTASPAKRARTPRVRARFSAPGQGCGCISDHCQSDQ